MRPPPAVARAAAVAVAAAWVEAAAVEEEEVAADSRGRAVAPEGEEQWEEAIEVSAAAAEKEAALYLARATLVARVEEDPTEEALMLLLPLPLLLLCATFALLLDCPLAASKISRRQANRSWRLLLRPRLCTDAR